MKPISYRGGIVSLLLPDDWLEAYEEDQIVEWTDAHNPRVQQTALCPACGIDSVIGDASG